MQFLILTVSVAMIGFVSLSAADAQWSSEVKNGVASASFAGVEQARWQIEPVRRPRAKSGFQPSAFLHPLKTPAGFEWTHSMPRDHIHHLGLWWPWKYVEVDGERYNCWELQQGEGVHRAIGVNVVSAGPDAIEWGLENEIRIRKPGRGAGPPVTDGIPVIRENVRMRIARHGEDGNVLDIDIRHSAIDNPVRIINYRYSGFCWRGPVSWNAQNSVMTTDLSHGHAQANGTESRWVIVTGPAGGEATASVLLMSAAVEIAGVRERLRIWGPNDHKGTPFVNFNPVQQEDLPLDAENPAVSHRQYRVIAADRALTADEAEAEWKAWREAGK